MLNYIVEEDVASYKRMLTQKEGSSKYYYRLKTVNGISGSKKREPLKEYVYNIIHWAKFIHDK